MSYINLIGVPVIFKILTLFFGVYQVKMFTLPNEDHPFRNIFFLSGIYEYVAVCKQCVVSVRKGRTRKFGYPK